VEGIGISREWVALVKTKDPASEIVSHGMRGVLKLQAAISSDVLFFGLAVNGS
jgi:hypothetical protein